MIEELLKDPILESLNIDEAAAELCRRDFSFFVQEFWDEIVKGSPLIWNWHMDELCQILQEIGFNLVENKPKTDFICNVPPGSSKTSICSILYPVWLWTLAPELVIITISYSDKIAQANSLKSRDIIYSEKFKRYFPYVNLRSDSNAVSNYRNTGGGERIVTTPKGSLTGRHAHILIVDDPQNVKEANSTIERELVNAWISETLPSRKINQKTTSTCIIQQRLSPQDITGYLLAKSTNYKVLCIPAELDKSLYPVELEKYYKDGLYFPERYAKEALNDLKEELGARAYNTQFLQNPSSDSDATLKESWIKTITAEEFKAIVKDQVLIPTFYCDTSYSDKQKRKNDPSAILACTKIEQVLYILGVSQVWLDFTRLIEHIKSWTTEYGYTHKSKIYIEPKASGQSIVQYMEKQTDFNIVKGDDPRDSKEERLTAVSPKVEAGKIVLVDNGKWPMSKFISEITAARPLHDDMRDVLVAAIRDQLITKSKTYGSYINRIR